MRIAKVLAVVSLIAPLLHSCGGGGGGSSNNETSAPTFDTSAIDVTDQWSGTWRGAGGDCGSSGSMIMSLTQINSTLSGTVVAACGGLSSSVVVNGSISEADITLTDNEGDPYELTLQSNSSMTGTVTSSTLGAVLNLSLSR